MTRHELPYIDDYYNEEGEEIIRQTHRSADERRRAAAGVGQRFLAPNKEGVSMAEQDTVIEEEVNDSQVGKRQVAMRTGERLEWNRKLDLLFATRRPPDGSTNQARHLRIVRELGREFAGQLIANTPHCADQSAALRCVREAVLWAEEAIIHEGIA
jgi:hypothetical protein